MPGFEEFGKKAQEDKNNIQPRIGAVYDISGNGKDVVRAGWGIYYDFGYTNANILFPGLSAQGGSGVDLRRQQHRRHQESGRQLLHGRPAGLEHRRARTRSTRTGRSTARTSRAADPAAVDGADLASGWSHECRASTVFDVDYVHTDGHDLGVRWPLNTRINNGATAATPICPSIRRTRR